MLSEIDRVKEVLLGIGMRDTERATRFMHPTRYKQHNPFASDGIAGVEEWIKALPPEPDVPNIVRAFKDGSYVFTHTRANILGSNVFFDVFLFDDGLIVEHWDLFAAITPPNASGRTQLDGPFESRHAERTDLNKAVVIEFYGDVLIPRHYAQMSRFFDGDSLVQHASDFADGVGALKRFLARADGNQEASYINEIVFVLGQNDFVFVAAKGEQGDKACAFCDLYRLDGGKIVEHWSLSQPVPPVAQWKNDNGML